MITSSSFRALQGQRVRLYLSILRSLFCFRFFKGVFLVRLLTFVIFRRFTLSFSFRRLFGARQLTVDSKSFACPRGDVFASRR